MRAHNTAKVAMAALSLAWWAIVLLVLIGVVAVSIGGVVYTITTAGLPQLRLSYLEVVAGLAAVNTALLPTVIICVGLIVRHELRKAR
jgi:hypothetical protein